MDQWREWLKLPYGKKLRKLHAWNAWVVLLLAVSGIILYMPGIRGDLGVVRVWLKQAHIWLGVLSIVLIGLYVPLIGKHLWQLRGKAAQQSNLAVVLILLIGWALSGVVLWQFRSLPPAWSNTALVLHDLFSWVGIPYAIYHSISRSRWLKRQGVQQERQARADRQEARPDVAASQTGPASFEVGRAGPAMRRLDPPWYLSRRTFLRLSFAGAIAALVGPMFYRWFKMVSDSGGGTAGAFAASDGNRMLPPPEPAPESLEPIGGGADGYFRVYTVTPIPAFSSDRWEFTVSGLVENPLKLTWEQLLAVKRKVQVSDFHCVTGWSVYDCTWEGIPLMQLLDMAKIKPAAKFVKFYSGDGEYTDALSLEQARMEDVMVAMMLDGKPIPQKLGGPVRLIVPKMYAYKSVKWLQAIELIDKEHIGYWEVRGYDNDAWVGRSNIGY